MTGITPRRARIERQNTRIDGHLAYETGRSDFTFRTAKGEEKHLVGQFMTVWRRQPDGAGKVQFEAWLREGGSFRRALWRLPFGCPGTGQLTDG